MAIYEAQSPADGHETCQRKRVTKSVPLGTDVAFAAPIEEDEPLALTCWDLWFALVAAKEHGDDLGRLAEADAITQPYGSDAGT